MAHKYKGLIIGASIGLVLAITLLLVGGSMAGWDIAGWFDIRTSKYFQWTLIAIASLGLVKLGFVLPNYIKKHTR